ncbi:hypothetical protein D9M72_224180 [compost metagenome]
MNQDTTPRVLVVLGMHRSGTSLLSAGLEALGADFGDNLIPAREDNPKGYWEDARLVALNDEMLAACGLASGDVGLADGRLVATDAFEEFVGCAMQLLEELLAKRPLLGIKDPRMPRLMPVWQAAFDGLGVRVDYVLAVRHPLSVAASLAARDHLSREKSFLLWYEHSCRAMQWALGRGAVVVDYDRFLALPKEELLRIGRRLSLPIDEVACDRFLGDVLDPELRHSSYGEADLAAAEGCFHGLLEVYRLMQGLAADRSDSTAWAGLEREFRRVLPLLVAAGELDRKLWRMALSREEQRQLYEHSEVAKLELSGELASYRGQLDDYREQLARCAERLAVAESSLSALKDAVAYKDGELRELLASRSWRITRPMRWGGQLLRRLVGR